MPGGGRRRGAAGARAAAGMPRRMVHGRRRSRAWHARACADGQSFRSAVDERGSNQAADRTGLTGTVAPVTAPAPPLMTPPLASPGEEAWNAATHGAGLAL